MRRRDIAKLVATAGPLLLTKQAKSQSCAPLCYVRTASETAAGVSPTNTAYPPGDLRRYGGDPTNATDSSTALQAAIDVSAQSNGQVAAYVAAGCAYKVLTGATNAGTNPITVIGEGPTSQLWCDSNLITCTGGASNSLVDNLACYNITAPWIITRDPTDWSKNISSTLQRSNTVLGYQPTVNDLDIWPRLMRAQQTQQVGPVIKFSGAASGITVSRIYGRFVLVIIMDAVNSTIRDCDVRGGKGVWGTLQFDNWSSGVQRGSGNRAINNRVQYGSFSGIFFGANDDFSCIGNQSFRNGESGTKTLQTWGVTFSASVGSATGGRIIEPSGGIKNGTWTFVFQNGETRTVTVSRNTSCTWNGALSAGTIRSASVHGTTALNPQCFRGQILGNHCYQNYYDGIDADSTYTTTCDAAATYHQVNDNYSYNNGGTGMNADGRYNTYTGNHLYGNDTFGLWGLCSFSLISGNHLIGNNIRDSASLADLLSGIEGNTISDNVIVHTARAGFPLYAAQAADVAPHVINDNRTVGGTNFYGNLPNVYPVLNNNIDATTGPFTTQGFCFVLRNSAGSLQHAFYADGSESAPALSNRIKESSSGGFTTTPAGQDSSTGFAAGAKVSTTVPNAIVFDTAAQPATNVLASASIVYNSTGRALIVRPRLDSFGVNGVTRNRMTFEFYDASTGAAVALNTANIPAGAIVQVQFYGKLT